MLIDLDFAAFFCIFVLPKRREPPAPWFSPFFGQKCLGKEELSTSEVEKFLSDLRFFLSEMGEKNAETVPRNVKEIFFAKVQF